jgi:hypothetical protein
LLFVVVFLFISLVVWISHFFIFVNIFLQQSICFLSMNTRL